MIERGFCVRRLEHGQSVSQEINENKRPLYNLDIYQSYF